MHSDEGVVRLSSWQHPSYTHAPCHIIFFFVGLAPLPPLLLLLPLLLLFFLLLFLFFIDDDDEPSSPLPLLFHATT